MKERKKKYINIYKIKLSSNKIYLMQIYFIIQNYCVLLCIIMY